MATCRYLPSVRDPAHAGNVSISNRRLSKRRSIDSMNLERITIDPAVCHGQPCVRGLRYPVTFVLELLSSGMTTQEILDDYADLEHEDILAVLAYAARLSQVKRVQAVGA